MTGPSIYAWQVYDRGEWGTLSGVIPGIGHAPLVTRSSVIAEGLRPLAEGHRQVTGLPVRLARFDYAAVIEQLP